MKKGLTDIEKKAKERAGKEWNEQCKAFMQGRCPFRDKTARQCYERVLKILTTEHENELQKDL